jgi:hypothetical protein
MGLIVLGVGGFVALACCAGIFSGGGRVAENSSNKTNRQHADAKAAAEAEQREQEERDRQRRDELRRNKPELDARRAKEEAAYRLAKQEAASRAAKEEAAYRLAKVEFAAARKLKDARRLADDASEEVRRNPKEAARLRDLAADRYQEIVKSFPGTQAAADAQKLLDGKAVPDRPLPSVPRQPGPVPAERFPAERLSNLAYSVDLAFIEDWGSEVKQIPATVVDKGVLMAVPYQSFRAGNYEFNVYGDPEHPACLEIGVYKDLLGSLSAKQRCVAFMASLLPDPGDRCLLRSLNLNQDLRERGGLTFEVTPETAEDAYGGWWVSVYDTAALGKSRSSPQEREAITVQRDAPETSQAGGPAQWSPQELALARPGGKTVYVRGYTRKDGTYVQAHTRAAPGSGGGRRR